MTNDHCPVLEEVEWSSTEDTSPILVAFDEENNAVTFHETATGRLVHAWIPDRPSGDAARRTRRAPRRGRRRR